jgi:hypothetical protein
MQVSYAYITVTWWTYDKNDEMLFENYTVEIEFIRDGRGDEISMPKGMKITYYFYRDTERAATI